MSTETLSVVNGAIDVPGVAFKRNALEFTREVKLEELTKLLGAVGEMEGGVSWWYGDLALEIQARAALDERVNGDKDAKQGEDRENAEIRRMNMAVTYTVGHAEALGISQGHLRNCAMIARFYRPVIRDDRLSWKHHEVAMMGAGGAKGDLKKAKLWLQQAHENKWSVSDLRKQVNLALATHPAPESDPQANPFEVVDQVDAWLAKRPELPKITPDQAKAQLSRWEALVKFVHQLETIANAEAAP